MRPKTGPSISLETPERRWPKNTNPVFALARTGFRKFERASKAKRTAANVRNQPRLRSIGSSIGGNYAATLSQPVFESGPTLNLLRLRVDAQDRLSTTASS